MTIASAIDKINDKLAGTDKYAPVTIEGALNCLAETIPEGGWSGGGGSAFDGEILITLPETSEGEITYEVLSGSYEGLVAKYQGGGYPSVGVIVLDPSSEFIGSNVVYGLNFSEDDFIGLSVYSVDSCDPDTAVLKGNMMTLKWNSDDTVTLPE